MKKAIIISIGSVGIVCFAGCKNLMPYPDQSVGMANPASVYCAKLEGKEVLIDTPEGQRSDCVLPSGERLDSWALFRRDHRSIQ